MSYSAVIVNAFMFDNIKTSNIQAKLRNALISFLQKEILIDLLVAQFREERQGDKLKVARDTWSVALSFHT
jgi:hypothetical protein